MLGGGNPVSSSNPAGTGTSLNYIGNYAYAYSGTVSVPSDQSEGTLLNFTTGNSFIVARFQPFMVSDTSNKLRFIININSELTYQTVLNIASPYQVADELEILLPPYSTILITASNQSASSSKDVGCVITGEVYA